MEKTNYTEYYDLLKKELVPAYGCTEPATLAYASALASSLLESFPIEISVECSSSVIKNVFSVSIPNAKDMRGPRAAVILGAIISDPSLELCVLQNISEKQLEKAYALYNEDFCSVRLANNYDCLYIKVFARTDCNSIEVEIINEHTNVVSIKKNGIAIETSCIKKTSSPDKSFLSVKGIIDFADNCDIFLIKDLLEREIEYNTEISENGLMNDWGISVGKNLMQFYDNSDIRIRARAHAAAASDARMAGCVLPVIINSGSGNQGLTVSLPVIEYAKAYGISYEKLLRGLVVSNLIAILQKRTVGNLSAFCGAVHAAAGAACGICYMIDGTYDDISNVISFTLGTVGGMICDGAKSSCAAKISEALDTALMGLQLAEKKKSLSAGDGLITGDIEKTIDNYGKVGKDGMNLTNEIVLNLMLKNA